MRIADLSPKQRAALAQAAIRDIKRSREDPNAFIEFIGRAPGGKPVKQGKIHREWQKHLSENQYAIIRAPVGLGKSSQLRWRILWELGRNPNLRIAIVSISKEGNPKKFLDSIKAEITGNERLHQVFPNLRPQQTPRHWAGFSITVERSDTSSADPSIQLFGLNGKILGSRLDLVVMDDLHNAENTLTEASRDKIFKWVSGEVTSRGPQDGSVRIWCIGHRWHKRDALERLEKESGYKAINYSAFVEDPETGEEKPLIPHMTTIEHLRQLEKKLGILSGPMLRNRLSDLDHARFKREWFDRCLTAGTGLRLVERWNPMDSPTFTGVDLSTGGPKGDYSVFFTFTVLPDGSRRILDIRKGRWRAPEILRNAVDVYNRYGSRMFVESTGQQQLFIDFANELETLPIKKFHTGVNKWSVSNGIESLAFEIANGYWVIPNEYEADIVDEKTGQTKRKPIEGPPPIVEEWISAHIAFTPDPKEHTSDLVMATWFARECARQSGYSHEGWFETEDDDSFFNLDTLVR